jgi:DNA-binding NtrC family response regulator
VVATRRKGGGLSLMGAEECSCQGGSLMKNVLLIDDDLNHLAVLAVELLDAGYQVITEIDADSAAAVLRENVGIDLIIIDYQMPGLDALPFITMLRALRPKVPVIVLARDGNVDMYLKVMSLGVFEYMNKPVRVDQLRRVVEAAFLDSEQSGLPRIYQH